MDDAVTMHQTIALVLVIGIAAIALFLVGYVMVRHNVARAENNIRILTVCLVIPTVVMISFFPDSSIADSSAVYGLIGMIAGYIPGRAKDDTPAG
jgi:hypothetical protein